MDDIPWSKRSLAVLIEEGMLDELTANVATDWARGRSIVQTAMSRGHRREGCVGISSKNPGDL